LLGKFIAAVALFAAEAAGVINLQLLLMHAEVLFE